MSSAPSSRELSTVHIVYIIVAANAVQLLGLRDECPHSEPVIAGSGRLLAVASPPVMGNKGCAIRKCRMRIVRSLICRRAIARSRGAVCRVRFLFELANGCRMWRNRETLDAAVRMETGAGSLAGLFAPSLLSFRRSRWRHVGLVVRSGVGACLRMCCEGTCLVG